MAQHNVLGREGENRAVRFLEAEGYNITEKNWRYNGIEIDIIAINDEYIVFVEVKTRSSRNWGEPEEAIGTSKIRRMVLAADHYIQENDCNLPARFDIISIISDGKKFEIKHIEDAFGAPVN